MVCATAVMETVSTGPADYYYYLFCWYRGDENSYHFLPEMFCGWGLGTIQSAAHPTGPCSCVAWKCTRWCRNELQCLGGQTDKVVDYRGEHAQVRYTVYSVCVSVPIATAAQGSTNPATPSWLVNNVWLLNWSAIAVAKLVQRVLLLYLTAG